MGKSFLSRSVLGWAFFDFANSSYTTVIISSVYNRYFVNVVAGGLSSYDADSLWLSSLALSYLLVSFLSPIWGILGDISHNKKRYLFISYILCVIPCFLLFFTVSGDIVFAVVLVVLSNLAFSLSENSISSFLPELASFGFMGRVSGFAWGFGYLGGILSLLGSMFIIHFVGGNYGIRLSFLFTAIFFGVSAVPTFLWLKEERRGGAVYEGSFLRLIIFSYRKLLSTLRDIRGFSELVKLLLSYFLYYAGLMVIISYSAIYADRVFNFSDMEVILLIIVVNVASGVGSFIFGFVQDSFGAKRTLGLILMLWILLFGGIYYTDDRGIFWVMGVFLGFGIGAVQSTTRALVGIFSPKIYAGEFYGFWGFFGKLSSILGLYSFALLLSWFRSERYAILFSMLFFVLALVVLMFVREDRGIRQAGFKDFC